MSKRKSETERGHSCPQIEQKARSAFFDPYAKIDRHTHRLPHWQQGEVFYFVTWRLADALPQEKLDEWRELKAAWLQWHPEPWDAATAQQYHQLFTRRIDAWLDAGAGSCLLRDHRLAKVVVWQEDYWDRMIRHEEHFAMCRKYILENPEHARLPDREFILYDAMGTHEVA